MYLKSLATLAFITLTMQLAPVAKQARHFNNCVNASANAWPSSRSEAKAHRSSVSACNGGQRF